MMARRGRGGWGTFPLAGNNRSLRILRGIFSSSRWNGAATRSPHPLNHPTGRRTVNRSLLGLILVGILVYFNATILPYAFYKSHNQNMEEQFMEGVVKRHQESFNEQSHYQVLETGCSVSTFWRNCTREDFNNSIVLGDSNSVTGFLTIAIDVDDPTFTGLETTLSSILSSSTPDERRDVIIVIYLGEGVDRWAASNITQRIQEVFKEHLDNGFLQVVQSPLTSLHSQNGNDPSVVAANSSQLLPTRVLDHGFLFKFYQHVHQTEHFMQISDDVIMEMGFLTAILNYVRHHRNKFWITLDFATLGFVGKLYRRENLQSLADFCLFFWREQQPVALLYQYYNDLRMQRHVFLRTPSIFRRVSNRSLILKKSDFQGKPPDNPTGKVFSTMKPFSKNHLPQLAYHADHSKYFYGTFPKRGDEIVLVFDKPTPIRGVIVKTGLEKFPHRAEGSIRDILLDGRLEVSRKVVNRGTPVPECEDYMTIGYSILGSFSVIDIDEKYRDSVACLRIGVLQTQVQWIALHEISVWSK